MDFIHRLFHFRDLLAELRRFNSLSGGGGAGKGGGGADRILPPILRTLQLLLASPTAKAGKLRLWDGGGESGLREEEEGDKELGSEAASEVDDLRKVINCL